MDYEKMGKPVSTVVFHGRRYPVWTVAHNGRTFSVSSMALFDKVSCAQLMATADPQLDAVEQAIDYYVGPDEGPDTVVTLIQTVRHGTK